MKTTPFPYQVEDAQAIEDFDGRALLANDMGLGKTVTCFLWMEAQPYVRPVVVVCQASLREQWKKEAIKHMGLKSMILEGMTPLVDLPDKTPELVILSYDTVGPTKKFPFGGWLDWLKRIDPQLIILDECHLLANRTTKRTRNVKKLCEGVDCIIGLSGTAFLNQPVELYPMLNILRPDLFPSYFGFASRYANTIRTPWGWQIKGGRRLDELHRILLDNVMIRRRKADALSHLPKRQTIVVPVDLLHKDMKFYKEAELDFIGWLTREAPHKVPRARKAERLVRMHHLRRLAGTLKLPVITSWVENILSREKLILYAIHKAVVQCFKDKFGSRCAVVTGDTPAGKRQKQFDRFNEDKHCDLFLGNIDAAGVGWSCNSASAVAFAELAWVPGKHNQAADRVHGIGRGIHGQPSRAYYLIASGTIEEDIAAIQQRKWQDFSAAIDGRSSLEDEGNIFDLLEQRLLRRISSR